MTINFKDWQKTLHEGRKPEKDDHEPHPRHGDIGLTKGDARDAAYDEGQRHAAGNKHGSNAKAWGPEAKHYNAGFMSGRNDSDKWHKKMSKITRTEEVEIEEALKGNQDKLDVDKDGKIENSDLKKLRKGKEEIVVNKGENVKEEQGCSKKSFREFVEELEEAKKDDYWDFKDLKDEPKSTSRKIAGKAYGGAAQKDDDDEDEKPVAKPTEKRGRGRPAGSKSGARTAGNGKQYGGLTIHSLNLPSKK